MKACFSGLSIASLRLQLGLRKPREVRGSLKDAQIMKAGPGGEPCLAPSMGFSPSHDTCWASPAGISVDDGLQLMGKRCDHLSLI